MADINLLPQELKPKGSVVKLAKLLKKLVVGGTVTLFIAVGLLVALYFILSRRVSVLKENNTVIVREITALEKTEQRLFLVKDRLSKIDSVGKAANAYDETDLLIDLTDEFPPGITPSAVEITTESVTISVVADGSRSIANFLALLIAKDYEKIVMNFLSFDPLQGYRIDLEIAK